MNWVTTSNQIIQGQHIKQIEQQEVFGFCTQQKFCMVQLWNNNYFKEVDHQLKNFKYYYKSLVKFETQSVHRFNIQSFDISSNERHVVTQDQESLYFWDAVKEKLFNQISKGD